MLIGIKKKIKKFRSIKYQKIIFLKKDIETRNKIINHILKNIEKSSIKLKKCDACIFYSKFLDQSNFTIFYKKFNSKLKLKQKYNTKNFKKISKRDACFNSYLIFSKLMMKNNEINEVQKLNTILKVNDLLILKYLSENYPCQTKGFGKNIKYENKLINKYS